jgi:acetyl-CoA carboxylase biotin carboxyl carrier protein
MAAEEGTTNRASTGMKIDAALVRELAEMLADTGLTEIEVAEGDRRIRVARTAPPVAAQAYAPPPPAAPVASAGDAQPSPEPLAAPRTDAIRSPMVGTAYLHPEPGAEAFVKVGDKVKAGDTLVIVEAMKVMNPITATTDGTVREILISNAQPVEFDQPLMVIS